VDLSDEALLENFRLTKDPTAFKALVRRYQNRIYSAAFRILGSKEEAEEVVQDTCLKVCSGIERFKDDASFAAWLFRIAHNNCLDLMRAKRRRGGFRMFSFDPQSNSEEKERPDASGVVLQAADSSLNPAEALLLAEQGEIVERSLRQLPETQRIVIVLHDMEGFSYEEIAQIVGTSLGTVRSRLHYGRTKLKELLDPYFSSRDMTPAPR
jgi:RNA polymerase sigma-70 factor (ECF subfamily)